MAKTKEAYKPYAIACTETVPGDVLDILIELAEDLEASGFILRTGGNEVDTEIIEAVQDQEKVELFLPWEGFNDWDHTVKPMVGAYEMAWKYHPTWAELHEDDRRIHARTSHVIMGHDLNQPVKFLICYTDKDAVDADDVDQNIRIADTNLLPVFDFALGIDYTLNQIQEWMDKHD